LDRLEKWTVALPIFADGRIAGRVDVSGPANDGSALPVVAKLIELLSDLTPQVEAIMAQSMEPASETDSSLANAGASA
jgi:hypothetical protein